MESRNTFGSAVFGESMVAMKPFLLRLVVLASALAGPASEILAQQFMNREPEPGVFTFWVDPHFLELTTKGLGSHVPPIKQEAKDLLATKPTEESAKVHWGFPNHGWKLGLRLKKQELSVLEPVWVWALMGNLTDSNQQYTVHLGLDTWDVLLVTSEKRVVESKTMLRKRYWEEQDLARQPQLRHFRRLPATDILEPFRPRLKVPVEGGRVSLHFLSLGAEYDLTQPGTYYLTLSRQIAGEREGEVAQVMSGTVSFRIVEPPKKPSTANRELPASAGATPSLQSSNRDAMPVNPTMSVLANISTIKSWSSLRVVRVENRPSLLKRK